VIASYSEGSRGGYESGCDDELRFISQARISFLRRRQVTIDELVENRRMRDVLVAFINSLSDLVDLTSQVLIISRLVPSSGNGGHKVEDCSLFGAPPQAEELAGLSTRTNRVIYRGLERQ
jgi:hypothetical protein